MTEPEKTAAVPAARKPANPRKTRAHDARELAAMLGWTPGQVARALAAGNVLPAYDMRTPRWSGPVVDGLAARRDELTAALPDLADKDEVMQLLGVGYGDWRRGRDAEVIPAPDTGEFWSRPLAEDLAARAAEIREAIPPQPLGVRRCAELAAHKTGLELVGDDIEVLIERGLLAQVDWYKDWPLYDTGALIAMTGTDDGRAVLTEIVGERVAWLAGSIDTTAAAQWLDWDARDLKRVAAEQGLSSGRFGRWARTDIARLTYHQDLVEDVRRDRLLGPEQAAQHMEIRRIDFDYVRAAGWVAPVDHREMEVGVRKIVQVPLFRIGDLEDALDTPGVDWEEVRAVKPGQPSPLREWTRLPAKRAEIVHAFCGGVNEQWRVEVWPHFWNVGDRWEIDWEVRADGHPTVAEVDAALAAHPGAAAHRDRIRLSTAVGDTIRWARRMLEPGAAAVLDTETTDLDGVVVEIAAVDACTGETLLDTLVHPGGAPVEYGARAVHGITDTELAGAPRWADVVPRLLAALGTRRVLAYNADFDQARLAATHCNAGLDPADLPGADRWDCLMQARSIWARTGRWLPLRGRHRALGDAHDARTILQAITSPDGPR